MSPSIVNELDMHPELDARIRDGLCDCFPKDAANFSKTRKWHGSGPTFSVILEDAGLITAHVGVVDRKITVGGTPLRVAGVQNVFVRPAHRGRDLGNQVLQTAMDEAMRRGFDLGLLFCSEWLLRVYARGGWIALPDRETVRVDEEQKELPLPEGNHAMYLPLRQREFPPGRIHLQGNDW